MCVASLYFSDLLCKVLAKGAEIHPHQNLNISIVELDSILKKCKLCGFISRFTFILILGRKFIPVESIFVSHAIS